MSRAARRKRERAGARGAPTGATLSGARREANPSKGARREGAQRPEAGASPVGPGGVLEVLRGAQLEAAEADRRVRDAVDRAREAGHSWHDIGAALSMTAEGARQRFSVRVAPSGGG